MVRDELGFSTMASWPEVDALGNALSSIAHDTRLKRRGVPQYTVVDFMFLYNYGNAGNDAGGVPVTVLLEVLDTPLVLLPATIFEWEAHFKEYRVFDEEHRARELQESFRNDPFSQRFIEAFGIYKAGHGSLGQVSLCLRALMERFPTEVKDILQLLCFDTLVRDPLTRIRSFVEMQIANKRLITYPLLLTQLGLDSLQVHEELYREAHRRLTNIRARRLPDITDAQVFAQCAFVNSREKSFFRFFTGHLAYEMLVPLRCRFLRDEVPICRDMFTLSLELYLRDRGLFGSVECEQFVSEAQEIVTQYVALKNQTAHGGSGGNHNELVARRESRRRQLLRTYVEPPAELLGKKYEVLRPDHATGQSIMQLWALSRGLMKNQVKSSPLPARVDERLRMIEQFVNFLVASTKTEFLELEERRSSAKRELQQMLEETAKLIRTVILPGELYDDHKKFFENYALVFETQFRTFPRAVSEMKERLDRGESTISETEVKKWLEESGAERRNEIVVGLKELEIYCSENENYLAAEVFKRVGGSVRATG